MDNYNPNGPQDPNNPYGNNPQYSSPLSGGQQPPNAGGGQPPLHGMGGLLPNATAVLVLGILSIVSCWIYGVPGIILGAIGLVLGNKDRALYNANPGAYSNYGTSNAGRIMSLIGLVLGGLMLVLMIVGLIIGASMIPWSEMGRR